MNLLTSHGISELEAIVDKTMELERQYVEAVSRQMDDDAMESELRRAPWEFLSKVADHLVGQIATFQNQAGDVRAYGLVYGAICDLFSGETHCEIPLPDMNGTTEFACSCEAQTWCKSCFVPLCPEHIYWANGQAFCSTCCPY